MSIFINRGNELQLLERRYKGNKSEFIIIYGRRRIGKTELIKQFYGDKPHIYYLCTKENDMLQLEKIAKRIADHFNERQPVLSSWEDLFAYLSERSTKRLVFVVDEFPYLVEKNRAMPSLFQLAWDEYFKGTKLFLILCGSSVAMMERLLGSKSPLYGRRTGQLDVTPLAIRDAFKFFPHYTIAQKIAAYSVVGDVPMYLLEFDDKKDIIANIKETILRTDAILYKEPLFLLREELRDPATYLTILEGCTKPVRMNEIATKTGIAVHKLPKYLSVLQNLKYLKKLTKVTERKAKTKNTLYTITDNLFRFWFRFVYPNLSDIEGGDLDKVVKKLEAEITAFVGAPFENVCRAFIADTSQLNKPLWKFNKIGPWWGHYRKDGERKELEIDLIALNDTTKEIMFCECKWQEKVDARKIVDELKAKAKFVDWNNGKRLERYCVFAKSFKEKTTDKEFLLFDLTDLEKMFV